MSASAIARSEPQLLGLGIYDVVEVARLIHRGPETVARWTTGPKARILLEPQFGDVFSFLDLISLRVISVLRHRRVPFDDVRHGAEFLAESLGTARPFAHRKIATVGRAFFADVGEWVDAGKHGQGAFEDVIAPLIRPITYDNRDMASIWRPTSHVWINPEVQAGAPCIDGTRIPTHTIFDLIEDDEDIAYVAGDYDLSREQIKAAVRFEVSLDAA